MKQGVDSSSRLPGLWRVAQPVRLALFLIVWNLIMGAGRYLDGPFPERKIHTACGGAAIALTGLFTAFCGFAPLFFVSVRNRWFRPGVPWQGAKMELRLLVGIGLFMAVCGIWAAMTKPL
ncbi:MAG: hypothetical protein U1F77_16645 [Kiritimatiellia bacterium]